YNTLDNLFGKAEIAFKDLSSALNHAKPNELFCDGDLIKKELQTFSLVEIVNARLSQDDSKSNEKVLKQACLPARQVQHDLVIFNTKPQPSFNKQFNLLVENFHQNSENGYKN